MSDVRLAPMTDEQFEAYQAISFKDYADDLVKSGRMSEEAALTEAETQFRQSLPQGLASADQHLFTAYVGEVEVGLVWVQVQERDGEPRAWIFDIRVKPEARLQGFGRQMMLAVEEFSRARGAVSIGLNVFGFNTGARALYEEIGYEIVSIHMKKVL
jgi:ribosomal protein S18 acetylase RimI-like enzyme